MQPVINIADCIIDGNYVYFALCNFGTLYMLDLNSYELEKIADIPSSRQMEYRTGIKSILEYHKKIYMFSYEDDDCYIYDRISREIATLRNYTGIEGFKGPISGAFVINDRIWIIPQTSRQRLYSYDEKSGLIEDHHWYEKIKELVIEGSSLLFHFDPVIIENEIWTAIYDGNRIIRYHTDTKKLSVICTKYRIARLSYKDGYLWMAVNDFIGFVRYSIRTGVFEEFYFCEWDKEGTAFTRFFFWNSWVLMLPFDYEQILCFDMQKEEYKTIALSGRKYAHFCKNNKLYLLPYGKNDIWMPIIDLTKMEIERSVELKFQYEDCYNLYTKCHKIVLQKEENFDLKDYIKYIIEHDSYENNKKKFSYENIGQNIYSNI